MRAAGGSAAPAVSPLAPPGDNLWLALSYDAVEEVLRASEDDLRPAPAGELDAVGELCERDGRFLPVIDLDRVLDLV